MKKILSIAVSAVLLAGSAVGIAPRKANATAGCAPEDVYEVVMLDYGSRADDFNYEHWGTYGNLDDVVPTEIARFESCSNDFEADRVIADGIIAQKGANVASLDNVKVGSVYNFIESDPLYRSVDGCTRVFNYFKLFLPIEAEEQDGE